MGPFPCVTCLGLPCYSCKLLASPLQVHGCNWFSVSLFPCPFTTEGKQKGLSGQWSKYMVYMSIAIVELLHLWTFRHVCSSNVGSKCSRSAGYPFAVGQPICPDCKTLKKKWEEKGWGRSWEGVISEGQAGAKVCSRVRIYIFWSSGRHVSGWQGQSNMKDSFSSARTHFFCSKWECSNAEVCILYSWCSCT